MNILLTEKQLKNLVLKIINEDFKTRRELFIKQGYSAEIVDSYLTKFKNIKNRKFNDVFDDNLKITVPKDKRFDIDAYNDFHDLEVLVDYVVGRRKTATKIDKNDIDVDAKPIFENDDYIVYYADTPKACIKYKGNIPYSWCVARSDSSNMFYTYRLRGDNPSFYFVKNKKLTEKEFESWDSQNFNGKFKYPYHFFVVQVLPTYSSNYNYIVTSANNDGDVQMKWEKIQALGDNINTIKNILTPKPLTSDDKEKISRFVNGLSDSEFGKLTYDDKKYYLDVYPSTDKQITDAQFDMLPDDLKNHYISFGLGLSDKQFDTIKDKKQLLKRYQDITIIKLKKYLELYDKKSDDYEEYVEFLLTSSEVKILPENDRNSYLNTLNKYQIWQLGFGKKPEIVTEINFNGSLDEYLNLKDINTKYFLDLLNNEFYNYINTSNDDYYSTIKYHADVENERKIMNISKKILEENDLDFEDMDLYDILNTYDEYLEDIKDAVNDCEFNALGDAYVGQAYEILIQALSEYGKVEYYEVYGESINAKIKINVYNLIDDFNLFNEYYYNCNTGEYNDSLYECIFEEAMNNDIIEQPEISSYSFDNAYIDEKLFNELLKEKLEEIE